MKLRWNHEIECDRQKYIQEKRELQLWNGQQVPVSLLLALGQQGRRPQVQAGAGLRDARGGALLCPVRALRAARSCTTSWHPAPVGATGVECGGRRRFVREAEARMGSGRRQHDAAAGEGVGVGLVAAAWMNLRC